MTQYFKIHNIYKHENFVTGYDPKQNENKQITKTPTQNVIYITSDKANKKQNNNGK